jgi:21S rRNA (uridine2791-2'-O)-methyltransferase
LLHELDLKYRRSVHECDLLIKDEEARRLKLRSMVLRDEASLSKDQLSHRDVRIKELVEQTEDARNQLQSAEEKSRRQDMLIQTHSREIANLKVRSHS